MATALDAGKSLAQLVREQRFPFIRKGKHGTRKSIGLEARFAEKYVVEPSGCWRWTGLGGGNQRYGNLMISHRSFYAHILSYLLFRGDIPLGLNVLHECDNPKCVNPQHLFLGTQKDNMRDAARKGRTTIGERNPAAKLNMIKVVAIRQRVAGGSTHQVAADEFGVSRGNVSRIVNNQTWRV